MREDNGDTRDVARAYREALRREKRDLPAYNMRHARQAVSEIIAADLRDRDRSLGEAVSYDS